MDYDWAVGRVLHKTRKLRFTLEEAIAICELCDEPYDNKDEANLFKCSECPVCNKIGKPIPEWKQEFAK